MNQELQKALQAALEAACYQDNGCSVQEYLYRDQFTWWDYIKGRRTPARRWFLAPHLDPERRDDLLANRAYKE